MREKDQMVEIMKILSKRVITFYPAYARIFNGMGEAIFFQQIFYWCDRGDLGGGVIYKTDREIEEETTLTSRQQDRIRKNLCRLGVLETWIAKVRGVPTHHYRINWGVLRKVILEFYKMSNSTITEMTSEKRAFLLNKRNASRAPEKSRTYKTSLTNEIVNQFKEKCIKEIGIEPTMTVRDHRAVTFALNSGHLTKSQILDLFDEWFRLGHSDEETTSLTRSLSAKQINGYKVRNGIVRDRL